MADTELRMLIEFLRLGAEDDYEPRDLDESEDICEASSMYLSKVGRLFGFGKKKKSKEPGFEKPKDGKPSDMLKYAGGKNKDKGSEIENPTKPAKPREKWVSAGCVVFDSLKDMSKVYVIQQKNWNTWAFPKGRVDEGESIKKTAVREVAEETGLHVTLLPSGYLGKGVGSYSITHFFAAVRSGGSPGQHDHEVSKVKLVSFTEAFKLFRKSGGKAGKRDLMILRRAWEYSNKHRKGKV